MVSVAQETNKFKQSTPWTKLTGMWKVLQADTLRRFVQIKTMKFHMMFLFR